MKNVFRPLASSIDASGMQGGFFEELRESFTDSFAYDHFQWPSFQIYGAARPSIVDFRSPAARAAEDRGLPGGDGESGGGGGDGGGGAVSLYTTTNSDIPIYTIGEVVPVGDGVTPQTAQSGPLIAIDDFRADARFADIDGSGYGIVIIDSGIDLDDPFFGPDSDGDGISDRIVYQYDFADNDSNAGDLDGHGSNVASIAASSDGTYTGMAPGADIIALKVFSDSGSGYFSDIEESLQWVINNAEAYNIVSVNMSLGDTNNYNTPVSLYGIGDELAVLASMGVVVVSASGNDFYSFNSVQGVSYPSADPNSLSIGAVYDGNTGGWQYQSGAIAYTTTDDQITPFSQRDDELTTVFAPGAPITGAGAGTDLVTIHGTSQAAPHIAGIIALAQQLAVETIGRKLTYDEIESLLASTGDIIIDGDNENDNVNNTGLAFPRVNMVKLGEAILDMAPDSTPPSYAIAAADAVKAEGDNGTTLFTFTVTRGGNAANAGSVDYSVSGAGSKAADGADFAGGVLPGGTVTFAAGQTSKTLTVQVAGDTAFEGDEGFTVTLYNTSDGGTITTPAAAGSIVNDDSEGLPPDTSIVLQAGFDTTGDTEGFTYGDGLFGGSGSQRYANGAWDDQALTVSLGGINNNYARDISGGWQTGFTLDAESEVSLSFRYVLNIGTDYEPNEYSQVLVSIDGGTPILVDSLTGDGNGGNEQQTGPQTFTAVLGSLAAGSHTLAIGAYNNQKSWFLEKTDLVIDDVQLTIPSGGSPAPLPVSFAIAAEDSVKAEGDGGTTAFTFTVTRSGNTGVAGSVDYAVSGAGSDAADGADFPGGALPAGTLAFAAGETVKTLTLNVAGDTGFEADEGFTVTLSNPTGGAPGITTASANGTILNDDPAPPATLFSIAALDAVKAEGDTGSTAFTFTVTRSGDISAAGSVYYQASGDTDAYDFHGVPPGGTLSFVAGQASKTLTILASGDKTVEDDEAFTVTLSNPSGGAGIDVGSADGLIVNDDFPPTTFLEVAALDAVKAEGDAGATEFTFTVTRSGDLSIASTVSYGVMHPGTADFANVSDFVGGVWPSGSLSFASGEASKTLTFEVAGDIDVEADEAFAVVLSNVSKGSAITTEKAFGTILNDDTTSVSYISIVAEGTGLAETDSNPIPHGFLVTRSGDLSQSVTVDYAVTGGDADAADFQGGILPSGSLSFAAGQASKGIIITVAGDYDYEPDETFIVSLSNPTGNGEIVTGSAEGLILNDDQEPGTTFYAISATDAVKAEGDSGDTFFTFTITRTGDLSFYSAVHYSVSGSGANPADGDDFLTGLIDSGVVTFAATQTSATINVRVSGDTTFEPDEDFVVTIFDASAEGVILTGSATGTILNDDPQPTTSSFSVFAEDAVLAEGDGGTTAFTFTVYRNGDTAQAAAVDYAVGGAAVDGADFAGGALPAGTLSFAAGQFSQTLTIEVAGDTDLEPNEDFSVILSNPSPGVSLNVATASGTIVNDDQGAPSALFSIAATDAVKAEGDSDSTPFTFTITRAGDTSAAASVDWAVKAAAADISDFMVVLAHSTANFSAGQVSKTLTINVRGDLSIEEDENFFVTLSNPSDGSGIATASAEGIILNDDFELAPNLLSIHAVDAVKTEGDTGTTYLTFEITRSGDLTTNGPIVNWQLTGDDVDVDDFSTAYLPGQSFNFTPGETSKMITVAVAGDNQAEGDESFIISLSTTSAGVGIDVGSATGTILDDDALPQAATSFAIAALDASNGEGDSGTTAFTFTVTRSGDASAAGSVDYAVITGATFPEAEASDFVGGVLPSGTVSFAAGETSKTLTIAVQGDTRQEAQEGFTVALTNPSAGSDIATGSALGTILNDDSGIDYTYFAVSAADAAKPEGDAGTTALTFLVTRSGNTSATDTIEFDVTGSGANPAVAEDFAGGSLPSGSVTFAVGETSKLVSILVAGDSAIEADEEFTFTLRHPPENGIIQTFSATATILNDDAAPPATFYEISALDAAKAEGDAGTSLFSFTISRSGDLSNPASISYSLAGDGANPADSSDFASGLFVLNTATFAAGESSVTVNIRVAGDVNFEADEGFVVTIFDPTNGGAVVGGSDSATGTIVNDDPVPITGSFAIAADDAVKAEGDSGSTALTFLVTRSGDAGAPASVDYAMTSGGPTAGDFLSGTLPAGTLNFAAGETGKLLTIEVAGDTEVEPDESFIITLSNPSAGSDIGTATAVGTILNDDVPPPATFFAIAAEDAVKEEGLINETFLTFTVTRSGDISLAGTVDYAVSGAVDADDFVGGLPAGTLSFTAGEASKTLSFNVAGDGVEEPDESFTVTLSNASAGAAITAASAGGTILNDDGPPQPPVDTFLSISALDAVKSEGDSGTTVYSFVISRSGDLIDSTSVDFTVIGSGGNPADASDFLGGVLPSGSVLLQGEGVSGQTIYIEVAGDSAIEADEGFTVVLSNPSAGAEITTPSATGTILNDDTATPPPGNTVVLLQADFDAPGDTGGFTYSDGLFDGSPSQRYADGAWSDGALTVELGGIDTRPAYNISGGWKSDFVLTEAMDVSLTFDYTLLTAAGYEPDEYGQLLVRVDGGTPILVAEIFDGGSLSSGPDGVTLDLGTLGAGSHSIAIGGYNNKKSSSDERTEITIDDLLVTGTAATGSAEAQTAGLPIGGSPIDPGDHRYGGLSETDLLSTSGF